MAAQINHKALYRLPWNYADNGISWLEPTAKCNLACEGCYRNTRKAKHKSLEEIREDLEVFGRFRKSDCMSIAGGDPLVHPQIVEIVKIVREMGWKPIVNTNGLALTEELLHQLKKAGAFGFTFHIDTSQRRPKMKQIEREAELNDLRLHYAEMLAREGGLACSFNATVSSETVSQVPDLVRWAQQHPDKVHTLVFILFRSPDLAGNEFDIFVNGKIIREESIYKETAWGGDHLLYSQDVVEKIREADSLYEPSAYLNGTANPDSLKWLLATRVIFNGRVMGYVSPRFQEMVQTVHHLLKGKYLSYTKPNFTARAKLTAFLLALVDRNMRHILLQIIRQIIKNPLTIFKPAYFQSFMIIQPVNIEADGRQDMCDGCPDITVHKGRLVWSCRLEELNAYDSFYTFIPKANQKETAGI